MSTLTRAELITKIRFLFSDSVTSNMVIREDLTAIPQNIIDSSNLNFRLLNRRIVSVSLYDAANTVVSPANYTLTSLTGEIIFGTGHAPTVRLYANYYWQKLTDDEIGEIIDISKSSGNFNPDSVSDTSELDYVIRYCVATCYEVASTKSAEYYTMSAAGKQVSKSEQFNHFTQLAAKFMELAKALRTDSKTDRGERDVPVMRDVISNWADPYFPTNEGGGF